jgi:hypothetical protein
VSHLGKVPVALATAGGVIVLLDYFVGGSYVISGLSNSFLVWAAIIAAFAMILGIANVVAVHYQRIVKTENGWPYSVALLVTMATVVLFGILPGGGGLNNVVVDWIFDYVYLPLSATIFSLLAFFVATAAFRALRIRTPGSWAMIATGAIVLLGQIPLALTLPVLPDLSQWILDVPAMAGVRGILIGVGLGTITMGLRVLLGYERPYLE